jgi:predicted ArsR family transcriptional regulator
VEKIVKDLRVGQSTADSVADRVGLSAAATEAILARLCQDELVECFSLAGHPKLKVYRVTNKQHKTKV